MKSIVPVQEFRQPDVGAGAPYITVELIEYVAESKQPVTYAVSFGDIVHELTPSELETLAYEVEVARREASE